MDFQQPILAILSGSPVGFTLGLIGGGGSIMATPLLLYAVGMAPHAVGSFGLTTAVNYGLSGLIDWPVAAEYILSGVAGGLLGTALANRLAPRRAALNKVFAGLVFVVAAYML